MRKGSTRYCARTACRRPFVVQAGDFFVTCPACRQPWVGSRLGATQQLPHARERKLSKHEAGLALRVGDPSEVV